MYYAVLQYIKCSRIVDIYRRRELTNEHPYIKRPSAERALITFDALASILRRYRRYVSVESS